MAFLYHFSKYWFRSLFSECEYRTLFTRFRWFSNAQITKTGQSIIELRYLEDIKILCNFVLCSAIFVRFTKCSIDRKVENRTGDCIVLLEEIRERNLEERRKLSLAVASHHARCFIYIIMLNGHNLGLHVLHPFHGLGNRLRKVK